MRPKYLKNFIDKKPEITVKDNHLYLYGEIGSWWDENEARQVIDKIKSMEGDITVHVNSEGGNVFDGMAIMNALKQHKGKKTFILEGLAASIASVIVAGSSDKTIAMSGSCIMIHNAWSITFGNSKELRHEAEILEGIDREIVSLYNKKSGIAAEELAKRMNEEWWMFPQVAKDNGFVDEIDTTTEATYSNSTNFSAFNKVPEEIRNRIRASKPSNARDFEFELKKLGFSGKEAKAIISKGYGALRDVKHENNSDNEMLLKSLQMRSLALE